MVPIIERIKLQSKCVSMQVRQIKSCRVTFSFRISNAVYHITAFQVVSIYMLLYNSFIKYRITAVQCC